MSMSYTPPHYGAREVLFDELVGRFVRRAETGEGCRAPCQKDLAEGRELPAAKLAKKERPRSATSKSQFPVAAVVLLGSCLLLGSFGCGSGEREGPPEPDEPVATMAKYSRIKLGMTYKEVVALMQFEGEKISSSEADWIQTETYRWRGNWNTSVDVVFEQGRATNKTQFGLKQKRAPA
jgi:hypothetical protein